MEKECMENQDVQKKGNELTVEFDARSENESLARVIIAAFMARLDPTLEQVEDVKTAVSEAVTNAIIHGYGSGYAKAGGKVVMKAWLSEAGRLSVEVIDRGVGIADVEQAMQPLFTTGSQNERSGMGFSFMEAFMDGLEVESTPGEGTCVHMWKEFQKDQEQAKAILQAAVWNRSGRL